MRDHEGFDGTTPLTHAGRWQGCADCRAPSVAALVESAAPVFHDRSANQLEVPIRIGAVASDDASAKRLLRIGLDYGAQPAGERPAKVAAFQLHDATVALKQPLAKGPIFGGKSGTHALSVKGVLNGGSWFNRSADCCCSEQNSRESRC
jgi:hypothetical protein